MLTEEAFWGEYVHMLEAILSKKASKPGWWFQRLFIFHNIWDNPEIDQPIVVLAPQVSAIW